jgi:hypothetical protein
MEIKKEFCGNTVVIRTNCYGKSLEFITGLYEEAKKDFPDLQPSDVNVVYYAGKSYARTYGIEFKVAHVVTIPPNYFELRSLESLW